MDSSRAHFKGTCLIITNIYSWQLQIWGFILAFCCAETFSSICSSWKSIISYAGEKGTFLAVPITYPLQKQDWRMLIIYWEMDSHFCLSDCCSFAPQRFSHRNRKHRNILIYIAAYSSFNMWSRNSLWGWCNLILWASLFSDQERYPFCLPVVPERNFSFKNMFYSPGRCLSD